MQTLSSDLCYAAGLFHLAMACGFAHRHHLCPDIMGLAEGCKGSKPAWGHRSSSGELKPLSYFQASIHQQVFFSSGSVCRVSESLLV